MPSSNAATSASASRQPFLHDPGLCKARAGDVDQIDNGRGDLFGGLAFAAAAELPVGIGVPYKALLAKSVLTMGGMTMETWMLGYSARRSMRRLAVRLLRAALEARKRAIAGKGIRPRAEETLIRWPAPCSLK